MPFFQNPITAFRDDPVGAATTTAGNMVFPGLGYLLNWGRQRLQRPGMERSMEEGIQGNISNLNDRIWGISPSTSAALGGATPAPLDENDHASTAGPSGHTVSYFGEGNGHYISPNAQGGWNNGANGGSVGMGARTLGSSAAHAALQEMVGMNLGSGYQGTPSREMSGAEQRELKLANGKPIGKKMTDYYASMGYTPEEGVAWEMAGGRAPGGQQPMTPPMPQTTSQWNSFASQLN